MPMGNREDDATAMAVPTMVPPIATTTTRRPTVATRSPRVRPSVASVDWSRSASETSRDKTIATATAPATAATPAKTHSANVRTLIAS